MTTFYKMRLVPDEDGLEVITEEFHSIHETPCFHFCVTDWSLHILNISTREDGETLIQRAKRRGLKVYRVAKVGSRIAQPTKEKAFERLKFLKRRQLNHMERDIEFVKAFLDLVQDQGMECLEQNRQRLLVPNTKEMVNNHLVFL